MKHATEIANNQYPERKPRLLWANVYCLLDTSSGASIAVREMLRQLACNGYEIAIVGATIFDNPNGTYKLREYWEDLQKNQAKIIRINDGQLLHSLILTKHTQRDEMTSKEETLWLQLYTQVLDAFKPDLVFYYGGQAIDLIVGAEAKYRGIPVMFYLANGNYTGKRWCRDVDLIVTDSQATAGMYLERESYAITPVGAFIDPVSVVAAEHTRERLLFINPSLEKGAGLVIQLACLLEQRRPDIQFEVIESRGNWQVLVKAVTQSIGSPKESLSNVIVTPHTDDMRSIYRRARVLLAPSFWWESSGRVIAEAMLNGIPALIAGHGGSSEMMQNGGLVLKFPPECHVKPFTHIPKIETLKPLVDLLIRLYDDQSYYNDLVLKAYSVGQSIHSLRASTKRLMDAFEPFVNQRAGDK